MDVIGVAIAVSEFVLEHANGWALALLVVGALLGASALGLALAPASRTRVVSTVRVPGRRRLTASTPSRPLP